MAGLVGKDAIVSRRALQQLTWSIGTAIALCGFVLIAMIIYTGWSANGREVVAERSRIENALTESVVRVLEQQKSVAWWDDAVSKISNSFDSEFTDTNFGYFLTETYDQDEIYILNGRDAPIYGFAGGERLDPAAFSRRETELRGVIAEARGSPERLLTRRVDSFSDKQDGYKFLKGALNAARWSGKITTIGGTPAVVAAISIVPNVDLTLLKGEPFLLVSIVNIDSAFMEEVGHSLLIPNLRVVADNEAAGSIVSESFITDDGQNAGYLSWNTSEPGKPLLTVILPMVIIGVLAMWLLSAKMLRRLTAASLELAAREAKARYDATHDSLSGLPNRFHFMEMSTQALAAAGEIGIVVGYLDIDRFKDINDTLGHPTGDELIKQVGRRLRDCLGDACFVARFGGDEFAVFKRCGDLAESDVLKLQVAEAFIEPLPVHGLSLRVTVSLGMSRSPDHGTTTDDLMRHADIALYVAKKQGRNQAVVFDEEMASNVKDSREIEVGLREALDNNLLELFFQPIVSSNSRQITGVEALLRWFHPTKGAISPAVFIPIAEETGLMLDLGEWVLRNAIKHASCWPDLDVAINLSPAQFRHSDLPSLLQGILKQTEVNADRITLEITEGLLLERSPDTYTTLEKLRNMGFRIALDDFGTGFSSLKYLIDFRFDKLKIDRSFVHGMSQATSAQTIVRSVVQLGRALGMDVVAEGVETNIEATFMRTLGCDYMQGYYFSRPIPSRDVAGFIKSFNGSGQPLDSDQLDPSLRLIRRVDA